jgi:hypothetical protein
MLDLGENGAKHKILLKSMVPWATNRINMVIRHSRTRGMSHNRKIHRRMFGTVWVATVPALLVLSSLLVAQNVPLEFPRTPSVRQCSISAGSIHGQTQRFESDGMQWIAPVGAFVIVPFTEGANWALTQQPLPAIQTKGFHFNRPPPTS